MTLKLPAGLYALVDDGVRPELPLAEKARAVIDGGARVLQLRLEQTPDRPALEVIRAVVALARTADVRVIVNDRVDLALAGDADGVHLGDEDLPVRDARRLLGPAALIGATCRDLTQLRAAAEAGADYGGLGPVFTTTTKQLALPPLGLSGLARLAELSPIPLVAIAGISLETIGAVAAAGAHGAAVASGLLLAEDIAARARALQAEFFAGAGTRLEHVS